MQESKKSRDMMTLACVIIGALISAVNIKTFVQTGGLFPGGFTGLTVFIQRFCDKFFDITISYSLVNYTLNAIPAYIGFKLIGKRFTIYSILMILLTGIFVEIIPATAVTGDVLLIAVFGGIINGIAMGIALKGKASGGGTDFIAMWISKKTNASAWNYVLGMNAVLLIVAGCLFGWDKALYSIIYQFCSTQTINMLHTRYKRITLFIVTSKPDEIIEGLLDYTHHGITRFEGVGGYSGQKRTLLYTVIDFEEMKRVMLHVRKIDHTAFINATKTESLEGRFYVEPIE
ncbi:MAG: YitT family protein [Erysipelotrichaceae bacterium]|jgi:uncharacterized membrane-anchored protein YitT (DUF2179 family)|nr:YitT family protein [Erysipelotrichaceae bacterium]